MNSPEDCHISNRWLKFFRKWHRWPGMIMGFFFILWAISGIVMNHRQLFSGFDISRKWLPAEHRYVNWNNAAVKSSIKIGNDSLIVYGNIGIWLTDSTLSIYKDFNRGFPDGIDNRKISSMMVSRAGNIYAGTLFGLFFFDKSKDKWTRLEIPAHDKRIQWLEEKGNDILILTRSELFRAKDDPGNFKSEALSLPAPIGYDNKAGLFRTIWVIHSGEIYGISGKLLVDMLGIIVILLSITGALHFTMPYALRWLKKQKKSLKPASSTKRVSAKWHKKAGIWIALFLLINTITGMFLRPPLLITIANSKVGKIPWSVLDTPNPWEDKLRAVIWDDEIGGYLFGTTEGIFYASEDLRLPMILPPGQPPISVMGINVFRKEGQGSYLVGSFNGLYDWDLRAGVPGAGVPGDWSAVPYNHISGLLPPPVKARSKPFGDEMVSGYLKLENGNSAYFDYNKGVVPLSAGFKPAPMPREIIDKSPMSWWNFALEVHTGRIFKPLIGDFYILIVPLFGIFGSILVISGIIVWIKLYVRKNRKILPSTS